MTNPLRILNALLFGRKDSASPETSETAADLPPEGYPLQPPRDEMKWRRAYSRLS